MYNAELNQFFERVPFGTQIFARQSETNICIKFEYRKVHNGK